MKVVATPRNAAPAYVAKAEQYLVAARRSFDGREYDGAMLNAIHAAISSADAVCVIVLGERSASEDHQRAADLLEATQAEESVVRARQLRALLRLKNPVEYEARRSSAAETHDGVERATRLVEWAAEVVRKTSK